MDFLIAKNDLHSCRFADTAVLEPGPGHAVRT
jgi:hypothetical protein